MYLDGDHIRGRYGFMFLEVRAAADRGWMGQWLMSVCCESAG